jgi:uncharacterized protein YdeI (YjbR/CyaY-like superfamily)
MTLDMLSSAVPPEMVPAVVSKDMAKSAWETIKSVRQRRITFFANSRRQRSRRRRALTITQCT